MPSELFPNDEIVPFAIYDGTGKTVRLPASVGAALNLPRAQGADPMDQVDYGDPVNDAGRGWGYRADGSAPPQIQDTPPQIAALAQTPAAKQFLASNLGPKSGTANITQAAGPMGTIGQIGQQGLAGPTAAATGYATQADLDAATAPPADAAPTQPATPPATADALRAAGPAGVLNQQTAALADEANAGTKLAETEAARDLAVADAYTKRNDEIDKQIAARTKAAEDSARAIEQRTIEYDTAAKKYADFKPDRSLDHPIAMAISLILGGIGGVVKNDGSNPVLDVFNRAIDRKAQAQMQELDRLKDVAGTKRGDIDLLRQRASDRTAQYNLAIAGETEKAARQIEAVAARSSSAEVKNRAAIAAAQLRQKVAAATGDAVGAQMAKDERDRAFEEQKRATAVQEKQGQQRIAQGWAGVALERQKFDWSKEYQQKQLDNEAIKIAQSGNVESGKQVRELGVAAPPQAVQDANGNVTLKRDGVLTQPDGSAFMAPTKEEAVELRKKVGAANNLISILDEVRTIRERSGGESSWGNSDDYQRLQVLKNNLIILKKQGTQGMSSDEDMNKIIASLGAKDPTSFRAQAAGLEEGRNQIVKQINSDLHTQYGYQGKDLEWTDPLKAGKPPVTPDDAAYQKAISDPTRDGTNIAGDFGIDPTAPGGMEQARQKLLDAGGMTPSQAKTLDSFAAAATNPNATEQQREKAREYLFNASQAKTATKGVKEYAQSLLSNLATSNIQTSPEETGPATAVARDTSAGAGPATLTAQKENDALAANAVQAMPLQRIVQGAIAGDELSRKELNRRAGLGDKAARAAVLDVVKAGKR